MGSLLYYGLINGTLHVYFKASSLILFYKEYSIISSGSYQLLEYLEDPFHLPLSRKAYEEFQQLEIICEEVRSSEYRDCN